MPGAAHAWAAPGIIRWFIRAGSRSSGFLF